MVTAEPWSCIMRGLIFSALPPNHPWKPDLRSTCLMQSSHTEKEMLVTHASLAHTHRGCVLGTLAGSSGGYSIELWNFPCSTLEFLVQNIPRG